MPRFAKKLTRKIEIPMSALRQVMDKKKSDKKSNIRLQFAARFQNRSEKFLHYLFRNAFEIEFRVFCDFPKLVEATCARTFEREHLDQQVQYIRSFDQSRLETFATFVVVVESCV